MELILKQDVQNLGFKDDKKISDMTMAPQTENIDLMLF